MRRAAARHEEAALLGSTLWGIFQLRLPAFAHRSLEQAYAHAASLPLRGSAFGSCAIPDADRVTGRIVDRSITLDVDRWLGFSLGIRLRVRNSYVRDVGRRTFNFFRVVVPNPADDPPPSEAAAVSRMMPVALMPSRTEFVHPARMALHMPI